MRLRENGAAGSGKRKFDMTTEARRAGTPGGLILADPKTRKAASPMEKKDALQSLRKISLWPM